ncbi:type II toxin-antitoxin system antitoxin, RelB/DinJ family [Allofranklinella schreckenbergeri]|uniref:Type II toxin-antitoxin system antitoxin, RelB/DinJ family n=1 Tax=Allofranklinella schreckenbergeri TaxID=1076744 RepID=A0A3M6QGC2_9BURK|nr:type II toxin-antitoxin system antitoxin, RelB/DinJ family [Allofranklinella schreckenbergeri]
MTSDPVVQARINGQVKKEAAAVLAVMGLTLSDAMRAARAGELEPLALDQIQTDIQAAQAESIAITCKTAHALACRRQSSPMPESRAFFAIFAPAAPHA